MLGFPGFGFPGFGFRLSSGSHPALKAWIQSRLSHGGLVDLRLHLRLRHVGERR